MPLTLQALYDRIATFPRRHVGHTLLVAIDGCGGAGKSTLATKLQELGRGQVTVVHVDDFYKPMSQRDADSTVIGKDCDWERVRDQVLQPLTGGLEGRYQRYDWNDDALAEWHAIPVGGIVIVEGVYSSRREIASAYDFKIWVETPYDLRLLRGLERDGEAARDRWEKDWMPAEAQYAQEHRPAASADLVIDGSGQTANGFDFSQQKI